MNLAQEVYSQVGVPLRDVEAGLADALSDASNEARQVAMHLAQSGGKRVRPVLTLISARLFSKDLTPAIPVAVASEMIHMATLVHDDVIDRAQTRRGRKTVNYVWGNHVSVLAGDALLAKALVVLVDKTTPEVVRIMSDMIYRMCEGEIAQHASLFDINQTEEAYFQRIEKKTALFFAACCQAGAIMAGANAEEAQAMWSYGRHLGMAFQIVDDLLDFSGQEQVVGKPVGHDLESGVLTLPVLRLLKTGNSDEARRLLEKGARMTRAEVESTIRLVKEAGVLDDAFETARSFSDQAKASIENLPDGPSRRTLYDLADAVLTREF